VIVGAPLFSHTQLTLNGWLQVGGPCELARPQQLTHASARVCEICKIAFDSEFVDLRVGLGYFLVCRRGSLHAVTAACKRCQQRRPLASELWRFARQRRMLLRIALFWQQLAANPVKYRKRLRIEFEEDMPRSLLLS